ncbi:MAG TPA: hypothetical protein PK539_04770, partial [Candidatus Paceibacterota bacterium]|nr:hypothetical protein [Candidatus Paceibacterota bacterium]
CPGLTSLPELPAATDVRVDNCPGLTIFNAGKDERGYQFVAIKICGAWRIVAGCRNFTPDQARWHWGIGGPSQNSECLELAQKLIAEIEAVQP